MWPLGRGFPTACGSAGEESAWVLWVRCRRPGFDPWVVKIPWRRERLPHSSILAWRIPWTIQSMGSQRVGHNWATLTFPTPNLVHGLPRWLSVKNPPARAGDEGSILGLGRSLEKEMATHSAILTWRITMDRGAWGVAELNTTEWLTHTVTVQSIVTWRWSPHAAFSAASSKHRRWRAPASLCETIWLCLLFSIWFKQKCTLMKEMSFSLSECYLVFQKNTTSLEATSGLFSFGQNQRNVADKVSIKTFKHLVLVYLPYCQEIRTGQV